MTRRVLALFALTLLPALGRADAPPASPSPAAAPRIVVEPASFDFGTIKPGGVVQRQFVIDNIGRADLVIESIVSSCNCAAVLDDETRRTLKPGARTTMRVRLTAPAEAGKIQKSVLIKSNDPAQRTFEVKVEALVAGPREDKR
jgi:Protein of unknown function (DUF1573)